MTVRRVLFRCDAGAEIGGGHVMRCLTLARALAGAGWSITFAVSQDTLTITPTGLFEAYDLIVLAQKDDLPECAGAFDVAVIDHYGLGADYETRLREITGHVVAIDDFPDRPHDCDVLIDQNFGRSTADYVGMTPRAATVLAGTSYALLRAEFGATRAAGLPAKGEGGSSLNILVSLGLTDVGGVTCEVVNRLLAMNLNARINVVIGPAAPSRASLETLASDGQITLHIAADNMADLMAQADLCIGAGGTTSWERCCLGLPTVLLVLAENQRDIAASLAEAGAAISLTGWSKGELETAVARLTDNTEVLRVMATKAAMLCDGAGATRVVNAMGTLRADKTSPDGPMTARMADVGDRADLWLWRTHPRARAVSLSDDMIPWQDHCRWYDASLTRDGRIILIIEHSAEPVGYVRLDREGAAWLVSVALAPSRYGSGMGAAALAAGLAHLPGARFRADIHRDNTAAQRIFAACGFVRTGAGDDQFDIYQKHEDAA